MAMALCAMFKVFVELALRQGALALAVSVRITLPDAISAAEGIYAGFIIVGLLKIPLPEVVQSKLLYCDAVASEIFRTEPSQIVAGAPALTVACGINVSIMVSTAVIPHGAVG